MVDATSTKDTDDAQEPNYVSDDDDDDARPTRRRRSPRLNNFLEDERPDRPSNAPHKIVALAAAETADIPDLATQQSKLTRGYGAANLELQLKE